MPKTERIEIDILPNVHRKNDDVGEYLLSQILPIIPRTIGDDLGNDYQVFTYTSRDKHTFRIELTLAERHEVKVVDDPTLLKALEEAAASLGISVEDMARRFKKQYA